MALSSGLSFLYFSGAFVRGASGLFGFNQIYIPALDEDLHFGIDYNVKQDKKLSTQLMLKARAV